MPSKSPSELLAALVTRRYPIPVEVWGDFWDRLSSRDLHPGEALAVLSSLTTQIPDGASVSNLLDSLRERNPQPGPPPKNSARPVRRSGRATCSPRPTMNREATIRPRLHSPSTQKPYSPAVGSRRPWGGA